MFSILAAKRTISHSAAAVFGIELAAVLALSLTSALMTSLPARAQGFFDDRYPFLQQDRFRRQQPQFEEERPPNFSRAPAPKKVETPPASTIMVFGDAMADWLAYGLEDAFADTPEIGIVRRHKTYSGLIRYEPRRDTPDWAQAAREHVAAEKPNFILMMLGVNDRQAIREVVVRPAPPPVPPGPRAPGTQAAPSTPAPPGGATPRTPGAQAATPPAPAEPKPEQQNAEQGNPAQPDPQDAEQQPSIAAPEPARSGAARPAVSANHEYRSERWEELYIKKIDDTIAALKTSGVPVYWVGLPPLRGTRSTADMQYLNDLYRNRAEKAGIAYVEVWDGFIDDAGRFTVQGPDFEGQIRRLRTSDGVYFTKAGARKLAHYIEREIRRDLNRVIAPVALPVPEEAPAVLGAKPATPAAPAAPAARPLVGPVVPLTASVTETEELLGGSNPRPASDGPAARVLVKGEPIATAAGRADDFAWPPRVPSTDFAGPLPSGPPVAVAAPKPTQPQPTRQASAGTQGAPQQNRLAQQPQLYPRPTAGPYWRSPPPSSWGGGGGGFFGLFR